MKNIFAFILLLVQVSLYSQSSLPNSTRESGEVHVYTIDRTNLRKIHLNEEEITPKMLGACVAKFSKKNMTIPPLQRGNYLLVTTKNNKLVISDFVKDDLYYKIVPGEKIMLCLYDSTGRIIEDAKVKCGKKTLKFNKTTKTYNYSHVKKEKIIEIVNRDVCHYIELEPENYFYNASFWRKTEKSIQKMWRHSEYTILRIFNPNKHYRSKYTGFLVFSKPKYKQGETVKFKAHMALKDGTPFKKAVNIRLYSYSSKIDTCLIKLKPYRPGMYEYQFKLADSLNLKLDNNYTISLETEDKNTNFIQNSFKYEEYELKSSRFSIQTDKEEFAVGDSIKVKMKLTDENNMAIYDGKVEVCVIPDGGQNSPEGNYNSAFIPNVLWRDTIDFNGISEKEICIPDSIFPSKVSFYYNVNCTYLSADNEKVEQTKKLYRKADEYLIDFTFSKATLNIRQLHKGLSNEVKAKVRIEGEDKETILDNEQTLPYSLIVPWFASKITVTTDKCEASYTIEDQNDILACNFYRRNDSILLEVENPANIPFWYTLARGKKTLSSGYTTQLNFSEREKRNEGYKVQLSYLFGGKEAVIEKSLPFYRKNLSLDVSTPTSVYPGQKVNVLLSVSDHKGNAVKNTDITAYAFTSKFEHSGIPNIQIKGKSRYAKNFTTSQYSFDETNISESNLLNWNVWRTNFALDSIEYYKFLYPDKYYSYSEITDDSSTYVSPYLVKNGIIQNVSMLHIDKQLYYSDKAQQLPIYNFRIKPGKHDLEFRLYDRIVEVKNIHIKKGSKNIVSFDISSTDYTIQENNSLISVNVKMLSRKNRGKLNDSEMMILSSELISIENNFDKLKLPHSSRITLPVTLQSGNTLYSLNDTDRSEYNYTLRGSVKLPIIVGPFPSRNFMNGMSNIASVYCDNKLITNIGIEGGNNYTLYKNYQKLKPWNKNFITNRIPNKEIPLDFTQKPLSYEDIRESFTANLKYFLSNQYGIIETQVDSTGECLLNVSISQKLSKYRPILILISPDQKPDILYYGNTRNFLKLPKGKISFSLIFRDSSSYTQHLYLYPDGENYLKIDSVSPQHSSKYTKKAFEIFDQNTLRISIKNPYINDNSQKDSIIEIDKRVVEGIITGKVRDSEGEPLPGATVRIDGTNIGTITDSNGYFKLLGKGQQLTISYIGYVSETIALNKYNYDIRLKEQANYLEEIVTVGFGSNKGDLEIPNYLTGQVAGISVRGIQTTIDKPLIILNGVTFDGDLNNLDPSLLKNINILKDTTATSIYGSRAASGVIMIQTDQILSSPSHNNEEVYGSANSMRRNFHDDAFWQPRITTDKDGKASFEFTYPDDITNWKAHFIAIGNKNQSDINELNINSFKALSARLSVPRFAIRGDNLSAVGRIVNNLGDSVECVQTFQVGEKSKSENLKLASSHVDTMSFEAKEKDSILVSYSLQTKNTYFDGEERSIPIFEQGILETHGEFKIINDSLNHFFKVNPELGPIKVHAENSSFDLLLREIEKVDKYPYLCNEQIASKIKALLAKKQILKILGKEFSEDSKINKLIDKLNKNKNSDGLWGWWNKNQTEFWISKQVITALLEAESKGYKTKLEKEKLAARLEQDIKEALSKIDLLASNKVHPEVKRELYDRLILLKKMNIDTNYESYYKEIEYHLQSRTITDTLKTLQLKYLIGLGVNTDADTLLKYARKTMFGSVYWSQKQNDHYLLRYIPKPTEDDIENTLIAYNILKDKGKYKEILNNIRNYFFECRENASWKNIYEASCIMETILPDLCEEKKDFSQINIIINDKQINKLPYSTELNGIQSVNIKNKTGFPIFITAYQQAWNSTPTPKSEDFTVRSYFISEKDTSNTLTSGKSVRLEVEVFVENNANYVQIEIPIPAGCSYDTKDKYPEEIHREYFNDRVVIFCNKLQKGIHKFAVNLLPRYSGMYHLNPAKAELMYFPVFKGNNEIKLTRIN